MKKCSTVRVEVPKSQHKYVIGSRGTTIQEILKETGVSVEVPPPDSPTGTITLHGPHNKIGLGMYNDFLRSELILSDEIGDHLSSSCSVTLQLCQRYVKKRTP